jgi:hypothetical protein
MKRTKKEQTKAKRPVREIGADDLKAVTGGGWGDATPNNMNATGTP